MASQRVARELLLPLPHNSNCHCNHGALAGAVGLKVSSCAISLERRWHRQQPDSKADDSLRHQCLVKIVERNTLADAPPSMHELTAISPNPASQAMSSGSGPVGE